MIDWENVSVGLNWACCDSNTCVGGKGMCTTCAKQPLFLEPVMVRLPQNTFAERVYCYQMSF